ncbi:MAG: ATP-binding protein [Gammaproteobacteria bacterium]
MQSAETNFVFAQNGPADLKQLRWRPLSLVNTLSQMDSASLVLAALWFALIAICVWWGISGDSFAWNAWRFSLFGVPIDLQFYLPWSICVLLVMWLGLEWAAIPAYLATLFSTLHAGVPVAIALVNALHYPLGLSVYFLCFCTLSGGYALRSRRSWALFLAASFAAAMVSSIGAFISAFDVAANGTDLVATWLNWWLGNFMQSLVTVAPMILLASPMVERAKQRYLSHAPTEPFSAHKLLLATSMFALTLVLFILMDNHWQDMRAAAILGAPIPDNLRTQITTQFTVQHFVVWILALLLIAVSLGGVIVASRWIRRLRQASDSQSHVAAEALRRSEARFRYFFEDNPAPMWVYDPETSRFLEVNRAALRQYGYSRQEFLGMTIFDIRPPEEAERLRTIKPTVASDQYWRAGGWRHRRKDGSFLDVEMQVSSMAMDRHVVHLALVYDISPRKQAQAAMEQRARELQVLAAASLEIAAAQGFGQVLQIGVERARQLVGANLAVVRSRLQADQDGIERRISLAPQYARWADLETAVDGMSLCRLLAEKRPLRLTTEEFKSHPLFREMNTHKLAQLPLHGLLVVPLTTAGKPTGILVVSDKVEGEFDAQDEMLLTQLAQITSVGLDNVRLNDALRNHMHGLEQRVAERTEELDSSNRELDAFAYSVAHDLRAPLRAMHGFANAVLEDCGPHLDESGRNYLARIVKASQNMDVLIQDLLAYSHIGRAHMVLDAVRLDEVVQEAVAELAPEAEMRQARVRAEVPALMVQAHRGVLKQVVLNLVGNAVKFVAPGVKPEVTVRAETRDGRVMLAVSDNGIGIAPEHRDRIFNVFERLHGTETYPGTGIGLSIVKKGVARMQGDIKVESGASGSTFKITLKEFRRE